MLCRLGQTQLICCSSDPPVHLSFKKVGGNLGHIFFTLHNFSKHLAFLCIFLPVFSFIIIFPSQPYEMNLGKIGETTNQLSLALSAHYMVID